MALAFAQLGLASDVSSETEFSAELTGFEFESRWIAAKS
jgi:hypothetical protein